MNWPLNLPLHVPLDPNPSQRARYGFAWEKEELIKLDTLFRQRYSLDFIANRLYRPIVGILAELQQLGLVVRNHENGNYFPTPKANEKTGAQTMNEIVAKENTDKNIETVVRIRGRDASSMSDELIFKTIAAIENQIKQLEAIETKPAKLIAAIEALRADIKAMCAYVDNR